MKINPVFMKDLRLNVRSLKFSTIIFTYTLCFGLVSVIFLYASMHNVDGFLVFNYENCNQYIALVSGIELAVILFIVPIFTAGAIASEGEQHTLDYLLISKLKPGEIVCGKIAYALTAAFVLIISSFPANTIIIATGGVDIKIQFQLVSLFIVAAIYAASIGMFFSVVKKKTIPAMIYTYTTLLTLTIGTVIVYNLVHYVLEDMSIIRLSENNITSILFLLNPVATYAYITADISQGSSVKWFPVEVLPNCVEFSIFFQLVVSVFLIYKSSIKLKSISNGIKSTSKA